MDTPRLTTLVVSYSRNEACPALKVLCKAVPVNSSVRPLQSYGCATKCGTCHTIVRQVGSHLRARRRALHSPQGLSDVVKHGETIKLFIGDVNREEVETFCKEERAIPQVCRSVAE